MNSIQLLKKGEKATITAEVPMAIILVNTTPALPLSSSAKTRSLGHIGGTMDGTIDNPHSKTDIQVKYNVNLNVNATDDEAIEKRKLLSAAAAIA